MDSSLTLSSHRQRKHDTMVQRILDTARAIMREQGVAALSMQELARRLDMRAPSLYHYFAGKMDVYDALFRYGFSLYAEVVEHSYAENQSWQENARRSIASYLDFAIRNPDLYQLCFERPVPGFVPSAESLALSQRVLELSYRRAAEFKKSMDTDLAPQQIVDLLIAMMHGITAMHMANSPELPPDQGRFGPLIPVLMDLLQTSWSRS